MLRSMQSSWHQADAVELHRHCVDTEVGSVDAGEAVGSAPTDSVAGGTHEDCSVGLLMRIACLYVFVCTLFLRFTRERNEKYQAGADRTCAVDAVLGR